MLPVDATGASTGDKYWRPPRLSVSTRRLAAAPPVVEFCHIYTRTGYTHIDSIDAYYKLRIGLLATFYCQREASEREGVSIFTSVGCDSSSSSSSGFTNLIPDELIKLCWPFP